MRTEFLGRFLTSERENKEPKSQTENDSNIPPRSHSYLQPSTNLSFIIFRHLNKTTTPPGSSLLAEVARHIGLPEAIQVEETFGQAFGGCQIGTVAAIGEGVTAAQTEPVTEVLVQLRVCRQMGHLPAESVVENVEDASERVSD